MKMKACIFGVDRNIKFIPTGNEWKHPQCPHGPTLLFEKIDSKRQSSRKYFGCSANRNRKFCQFFHWADEPITKEKQTLWESVAKNHLNSLNLNRLRSRQDKINCCPVEACLKLCQKCSLLLFDTEWNKHSSHGDLQVIAYETKQTPTKFLTPLEEKKTNAQYFFSDKCAEFVVESLKTFGMKRILCIGTPRIFEFILSRKNELDMDCLLMDMDHRYVQFYEPKKFILYNLFSHHFFEGSADQRKFEDFVSSQEKTVVIIDPPFGGLISAIANTFRKISDQHRKKELPVLLFFPYFNEDRIQQEIPSLKMLDYKVNYTNHDKFKEGRSKTGSVVRIYTNLNAAKFVLPVEEGYRLCTICQRYVSRVNRHCPECNSCTSKDGRPYKHCQECGRCCKSTWEHCYKCKRCTLPTHCCLNKREPNSQIRQEKKRISNNQNSRTHSKRRR